MVLVGVVTVAESGVVKVTVAKLGIVKVTVAELGVVARVTVGEEAGGGGVGVGCTGVASGVAMGVRVGLIGVGGRVVVVARMAVPAPGPMVTLTPRAMVARTITILSHVVAMATVVDMVNMVVSDMGRRWVVMAEAIEHSILVRDVVMVTDGHLLALVARQLDVLAHFL